MLATGALYLRTVGPLYGCAGIALALYFASRGAGGVGWAITAGLTRLVLAAGGGWLALRLGTGEAGIFLALSLGLLAFAAINVLGLLLGGWLPRATRERNVARSLAADSNPAS